MSCAGSFGILTLSSGEFDMMEKDTFDKELDVNLGEYVSTCFDCLSLYLPFIAVLEMKPVTVQCFRFYHYRRGFL